MKSLTKNTIFNVIYKFLSLIFPVVTSVYVSRVIFPAGVGKVTHAQNIASYFIMLASLGIPTYGVKIIANYRDNQEEKNKSFSELMLLLGVFTLISSIAYFFLILSIPDFKKDLFLYSICGIQVVFTCINIDWLYGGEEEYVYIVCRSFIIKIISLLLLFLFVRSKDDYAIYALITCFAMVGNYLFNLWHSRKYVSFVTRGLDLRKHLKPIFTMSLILTLGTLYNKIDVTMLGIMADNDSIGYYSNAHKIIDIIISTCAAFSAAFLPRLSYYFKNYPEKISGLLKKGFNALFFISVPASVGIFIISTTIVRLLFGDMFIPSSITIRVLSCVIIFRVVGDLFCYQLLIASGNEKLRIKANLITTVINITLNALLIPMFRENGAAFASVVSEAFVNIYLFVIMKRKIQFKIDCSDAIKTIISSFLMLFFAIGINSININDIFRLILVIIISVIVYITSCLIMKNGFVIEFYTKIKKHLTSNRY